MIVNLANSVKLSDAEMDVVRKADILFDTSGRVIRGDDTLSELLKRFGREKFAFGTHSPILDYLTGRLRIESLPPSDGDEETKEILRSGNAKRMLGL
jgi:predicted TIM-barrel fold metal-dependent hydrolase